MDIRKLQRAIVDGLEDVKAQDIVVFNTEHLSPLFERVVVASGTSNRQTKALAASVRDRVKAAGGAVLSVEGEDNGEWIIVDCGSAVAHIMQPAIRQYYHLEEIWGGKPVRMKLGAAKTGLVKASESVDDDEADDTASDASTVAPRKAPARKRSTSAAEAAASGNKAAAKKAPARKAPANKAATDTKPAGAARKTTGKPAGKTTDRKTAPKSTAKVKTIVISPPVRKTAAKTAKKRSAPKA